MNKIKITLLAFILVSIASIVGTLFEIQWMVYLFKPLIIFTLLFLYVFSLPKRLKWYVMALELCFFGDLFLLFEGQLFLFLGLISFLLAHILFIKIIVNRIGKVVFKTALISSIPFIIIVGLLLFILKDSLNEMLIPAMLYGLVIAAFGTVALLDFFKTKSTSAFLMLVGAVVFIVSEAFFAVITFSAPSHSLEIAVIITYILAQYAIFKSMVLVQE